MVPTYMQPDYLRRTLRGWLRQTTRDFRLVVTDDGSSDATRDVVSAFRQEAAGSDLEVVYLWQEDQGFRKARALNRAAAHPGDESLLIFTDADCIAPSDYVAKHLAVHEANSFHVGGVNFLTVEETRSLTVQDVDAGSYESLVHATDTAHARRRRRKSAIGVFLRNPTRPKIWGANCAFDRSLFNAINGFDEDFEGWGYEDSDIRTRAMRYRPRPRVKNLYLQNDVFHLHPPVVRGDERARNRPRYREDRPVRCVRGLDQHLPSAAEAPRG